MTKIVKKSSRILKGKIQLPSSKSESARLLIIEAIVGKEQLSIKNLSKSTDTSTLRSSLESLMSLHKTNISLIENVLQKSELGINPQIDGQIIRLRIPDLTEERRKDLIKVVKSEGESSKISVRNIRRDSNDELKKLTKNKEISEDEERRLQDIIQKNTDTFIAEIDSMIDVKEKDLLTI